MSNEMPNQELTNQAHKKIATDWTELIRPDTSESLNKKEYHFSCSPHIFLNCTDSLSTNTRMSHQDFRFYE